MGCALQYASEELGSNTDFVVAAVALNGGALEHTSEELRNNPAVVLAAVTQNRSVVQYARPTLKALPELQRIAAIVDDAERAAAAADPATVWKIEVEHQAIATLAGDLDVVDDTDEEDEDYDEYEKSCGCDREDGMETANASAR